MKMWCPIMWIVVTSASSLRATANASYRWSKGELQSGTRFEAELLSMGVNYLASAWWHECMNEPLSDRNAPTFQFNSASLPSCNVARL